MKAWMQEGSRVGINMGKFGRITGFVEPMFSLQLDYRRHAREGFAKRGRGATCG